MFITGFAATFGTAEGVRAAQSKSRKEEHRMRKNNLVVHCPRGSKHGALLEGRRIVLARDKLYVDTGMEYNLPFGHPFEGYFLPYPDQRFSGLVSTITHEAPIMNWVYVHKETNEVRYGTRAPADGNVPGPWDCTRQDKRLTFAGWEGFCAVREAGGFWGLYFDRDGDGLRRLAKEGKVVVEVELLRTEMRVAQPEVVGGLTEEDKAKREMEELRVRKQAEEAARLRAQEEARKAEELRKDRAQAQGQPRSPRPQKLLVMSPREKVGLKSPREQKPMKSPRQQLQPKSPKVQQQPRSPRRPQNEKGVQNGNGTSRRRKGRASAKPFSTGPNGANGERTQ
ncbi:uncharacterized protein DNG_10212 [Cephalotrichum gorgonifer]|uniref:Uncharacterized protein n=1 Tax=Cephalotrichum gorgonifer TaxID=2041049 RepID=A0AAE8N8N1_9PEZI|nr:uncharacterized protein DNG_10212 [Cephalotrichum gorgonifer]